MRSFDDVDGIGRLEFNQMLFEFDKTPILFVCRDKSGRDYLCLCTDVIIEHTWLIAPVSTGTLIDMIEDRIPILAAYERADGPIVLAGRSDEQMTYVRYLFADLPEDELPDRDERLENPNLKAYLQQLYMRYRGNANAVAEVYSPEGMRIEYDYADSSVLRIMNLYFRWNAMIPKQESWGKKKSGFSTVRSGVYQAGTRGFMDNYGVIPQSNRQMTVSM